MTEPKTKRPRLCVDTESASEWLGPCSVTSPQDTGASNEGTLTSGGTGMEEVRDFLQECRLGQRAVVLLPHLEQLGVGCLLDLLDVERENLEGAALTVVERNRFFRSVNERLRPLSLSSASTSFTSSPHRGMTAACYQSSYPFAPHNHFGGATPSPQFHIGSGIPLVHVDVKNIRPVPMETEAGVLQSQTMPVNSTAVVAVPSCPLTTAASTGPLAPPTTLTPGPSAVQVIQVRYLLCSGLFSSEVCEKLVFNLDSATTAMKDLYGLIQHAEHVEEGFSLELYSHEGYPLNSNDYTCHCTLKQWRVTNNDLFYVFIRREDQPRPRRRNPNRKKLLHPTTGKDELTIESALFGSFTIRADVDSDTTDDIRCKVTSHTKVPPHHYCLLTRRGYEHLNVDTELRNGDILTLVLDDPNMYLGTCGTEYGKKTYNPVVPQSDMGLSKFFSILKFICSKNCKAVDFPRLLVFLQQLTHCPPIVHALKLLYENSFLSLPCWVALVEGCYQLFSSFLAEFCIVENKRVFEYSDYFWAFFISKAELLPPTDPIEYEKLSLICPISHLKITQPVTIPGCNEVFDRRSIIERMEAGVRIAGCSKFPITADDMEGHALTSRMLLYHPWEIEKDVYMLEERVASPCTGHRIPLVSLPCSWDELPAHIPSLRISAPDGLFTGNECLTFIAKGQLVFCMGFAKGKDSGSKFYNPVKCTYEYYGKPTMAKYAKAKEAVANVVCDLTTVLQSEVKARTPLSVLTRAKPEPIVAEKEVEKVDWEPEEAIVVLFDCSGSMSCHIFDHEEGYSTRLSAAKSFFEAFANRSQAYNFHHSMGLTVFNNLVNIIQPLTKIYEFFRESLERVIADSLTSLNDAMVNAVKQLKDYTQRYPNCRRRILCLTDGADNCSSKTASYVARTLQEEHVVVDTILINDDPENLTQKCISHASGGACFLPTSSAEALKLFEMETLLSVRARVLPEKLPTVHYSRDLKAYEYLALFPYNSGQLPSSFIAQVWDIRTVSTERILHAAKSVEETCASSPSHRRILREINEFRRNPHPDVEVFPSEENMSVWKILLKGPECTPYADGVFLLCVKFGSAYPAKPPEIRFLTPVYHCNINSSGRICHRVFGPSYTPSVTMREILSCVCGLLMSPEPDDPLDSVLADEYHSNRHVYMEKARKFTQEHAKKQTFTELKKALSGS